MSKSTKLVILLVIAAAVAYFLWKKGIFGKKAAADSALEREYAEDQAVTTSDPDEFEKELKKFVLRQKNLMGSLKLDGSKLRDSTQKKIVDTSRNIYIWCHDDNTDKWRAEDMVKRARNTGRSLDKQYLASALWAHSSDGWREKLISNGEYEKLVSQLESI